MESYLLRYQSRRKALVPSQLSTSICRGFHVPGRGWYQHWYRCGGAVRSSENFPVCWVGQEAYAGCERAIRAKHATGLIPRKATRAPNLWVIAGASMPAKRTIRRAVDDEGQLPKLRAIVNPSAPVRVRKPFPLVWNPPKPQPEGIKHWLSAEDFEEMEHLGGHKFNPEIRTGFNDTMNLVAHWIPERSGNEPVRKRSLERILKLCRSLERAMRDLETIEGTSFSRQLWEDTRPDKAAATVTEMVRRINPHHAPRRRGRPKQFEHLDTLVTHTAAHFRRAGGVASVSSQQVPSDHHCSGVIHKRQSPFLNILEFVYMRLPLSQRRISNKALFERADRLFEKRRDYWIVAAFLAPHMPADRCIPAVDWRQLYSGFPAWQTEHFKTRLSAERFRSAALDLGFSDVSKDKGQKSRA
jgi:hypothetical protein